MNSPDAAARFGSGRAVPRIEDDGLLKGRGRFTDDVAVPGEAVMPSCARRTRMRASRHRRRGGKRDARRGRVMTGAELVAAGVKRIPTTPDFKRADGAPRARPLRRALAHERVRFVGEAVAVVVAETRSRRATRPKRGGRVRGAAAGDRPARRDGSRRRRRLRRSTRQHRRRDAARRRGRDRGGLRAGRARGGARSASTSASRPRRSSHARCWPGSPNDGRLTLRMSTQMPSAVRDIAVRRPRAAAGKGARDRRRRRRRLRHEDRHLSGRRWPWLRADAEAAGANGSPIAARNSSRRTMAATSRAMPSSRSTATAGFWRCACSSLANVGAYATPAGRRDPAAGRPVGADQRLRHSDHRLPLQGRADQHGAHRRLPRRRPARGDLHSSSG